MTEFYKGEPSSFTDIAFDSGRIYERERILKLLEELIPAKTAYQMPMEYWVQRKLVEQAIALIKGGNK